MEPRGSGAERVVGGQFRLLRPLASGGMGTVFLAEQLGTGRLRAVKWMQPALLARPEARARFEREARVGALFQSDHLVDVLAAGIDEEGAPWLAMELLRGEELEAALRRAGPFAQGEARALFAQLGAALEAAHAAGVVHRDLKPANIFLCAPRRPGERFTLKVLDFGIAKVLQEGASAAQTSTLGTPLWMAPEQCTPGAEVRASTDLWAFGLLAFHALTGRLFWQTAQQEPVSVPALLRELLADPLPDASERARELGVEALVPAGFDAFFRRCVCRDPRARFGTAREATEALSALLSEATREPPYAPLDALEARLPAEASGTLTADPSPLALAATEAPSADLAATAVASSAAAEQPAARAPVPAPSRAGLLLALLAAAVALGGSGLWWRGRSRPPLFVSDAGAPSQGNSSENAVIRRVIRAELGRARACYEQALAVHPNLSGALTVRFRVERTGRVQSVFTGGSGDGLDDAPELRICLERLLRSTTFPPRDGVLDVTYPFDFRAP